MMRSFLSAEQSFRVGILEERGLTVALGLSIVLQGASVHQTVVFCMCAEIRCSQCNGGSEASEDARESHSLYDLAATGT